jgi:hypothetical protein
MSFDWPYSICPSCMDTLNKAMDKNGKCPECNGQMFRSGGTVGTKKDDLNHTESITCSDCGKTKEMINCKECE